MRETMMQKKQAAIQLSRKLAKEEEEEEKRWIKLKQTILENEGEAGAQIEEKKNF